MPAAPAVCRLTLKTTLTANPRKMASVQPRLTAPNSGGTSGFPRKLRVIQV